MRDSVYDLHERDYEAKVLKIVPIPHSRRADGCCWRHSRVLLPRLGEDVPREVGGVHPDGIADA